MTAIITRRQACILVLILISILCYSMVQLALKGIDYAATIIINNLSFVWLTIIYLLRPLTPKELARTRPLMLFALLFLVGEVLLYGFGVLHYTSATNDELLGQDYGGIMRISTTVGAATGTAVVIGLLGAINLTIYKLSMCSRIVLIVVSTIGVFFTMSRGSSLVWAIFLLIYFYMHFFKHYRFAKKVKSTIVLLVCLAAFNSLGGFTPILSRIEHMNSSDDVYASRDSKFEISKKMISESEPWGYGLAQVMPEKSVEKDHWPPYHFAPHNMYTLVTIELGWPGIILFIRLFMFLLALLSYRNPLSYYIVLTFLITGNTESVLLDSEWAALLLFAVMVASKGMKINNSIL